MPGIPVLFLNFESIPLIVLGHQLCFRSGCDNALQYMDGWRFTFPLPKRKIEASPTWTVQPETGEPRKNLSPPAMAVVYGVHRVVYGLVHIVTEIEA